MRLWLDSRPLRARGEGGNGCFYVHARWKPEREAEEEKRREEKRRREGEEEEEEEDEEGETKIEP